MRTRPTRTTFNLCALALLLVAAAAAPAQTQPRTESRTKAAAADDAAGFDVAALVREAHFNGARTHEHIHEFTWTETAKFKQYDRRGRLKEERPVQVWEIFPNRVTGRLILRKLVSEDGVALSAERAAKELKRLAEEIEKDEREAARRGEKERERLLRAGLKPPGYVPPGGADCTRSGYVTAFGNNGGLVAFSVPDFLCAGEFHSPRRVTLNGREAVRLNFRARRDYVPPTDDRAPIARMAGAVWIDRAERVVLRLEAWPATARDLKDDANDDRPAILYEEVKVAPDIWMRGLSVIDTTRRPDFFDKVNVYFNGVFSDYRRFGAEFDSYQLTAPKAQD